MDSLREANRETWDSKFFTAWCLVLRSHGEFGKIEGRGGTNDSKQIKIF